MAFSLAHYQEIEAELERRPIVRLVIVDPAGAYIGRGGVDDHKDSELRTLLDPLASLAARKRVTILIVKHLNKGATARAVNKVSGSAGYVNSVRAAYLIAPDPEDETRKFFMSIKYNLGPKQQALSYRIVEADEEMRNITLAPWLANLSEDEVARMGRQLCYPHWLGPVSKSADEVMSQSNHSPTRKKDLDAGTEWLKEFLQDRPQKSTKCVDTGNAKLNLNRNLKWWRDDVLKSRLGGKPRKIGFGDGCWWFTLPNHAWPFPGLEEAEKSEESQPKNRDSSGDGSEESQKTMF